MEDIPSGLSGVNVQQLVVGEVVLIQEPAPTRHQKIKEKPALNRIWVLIWNLKNVTPETVVSIMYSLLYIYFSCS